jgi:hypothetical protein
MREQIRRVKFRNDESIPEAKAQRVNMVTSRSPDDAQMQKIGCALIVLMQCMTQAKANGECDGECDSRPASAGQADDDSDTGSMMIKITMAVSLLIVGYLAGRCSALDEAQYQRELQEWADTHWEANQWRLWQDRRDRDWMWWNSGNNDHFSIARTDWT